MTKEECCHSEERISPLSVILRSGFPPPCHSEEWIPPPCHSEELRSEESSGRCFWDEREDSSLRSE